MYQLEQFLRDLTYIHILLLMTKLIYVWAKELILILIYFADNDSINYNSIDSMFILMPVFNAAFGYTYMK